MLDVLEANELLERAEELNRKGQYRDLLKWLDGVPHELFRLSPELYLLRGRANLQLGYYKRALNAIERVNRLGFVARNTALSRRYRNLLGVTMVQLGKLQTAEACFSQVAWMANEVSDRRELAIAWMNLGVVYDIQCEWEAALVSYQRALTELEKLGDQGRTAQCEHNMATTYRQLNQLHEAEAHFDRALSGLIRFGGPSDLLRSKAERALLLERHGDYHLAAKMASDALADAEATEDLPCEAELLRVCGIISRARGSIATARKYLKRSLHLARQIRSPLLEAEVHEELATCGFRAGHPRVGERHLIRAALHYEAIGAEIRARKVRFRIINFITSGEV
jgi:tetratricopeptide (TPR) repeat protein